MANYYVSRFLIDGGRSCDITFVELFEKVGMEKEKL